uniref:Solute carrier family 35 member A5 n=1 Tax=Mandrillus leucophaeus TaxID=9568 RepID=A0A2K5XWZ3_MANLE
MEKQCCSHPIICSLSTMYTFLLGAIFIALSSSRILLVKYSANEENKYDYLPTSVNVCSELVKLVFCVLVSVCVIKKDHQSTNLKYASWKEFSNFMKWSIPAFLYFLDNLIVFYVLSYLQPAMAVIFSNFSIITTALLFRIVLKGSGEMSGVSFHCFVSVKLKNEFSHADSVVISDCQLTLQEGVV